MNLPSKHQTEEKSLTVSACVKALEGNQQHTDACSSTPAAGDCSVANVSLQLAPWASFLALGLVSVGIHVLVLRIPVPTMQPISSKPHQAIKVTRLAVTPTSKRSSPTTLPTKAKTLAKPNVPAHSPRLGRLPKRTAIDSLRQTSPSPFPSASPNSKVPTSQGSPSAPPAPQQTQPPEPDFKDFPTYPGSDLSPESPALATSDDFKKVVDYFDQALSGDQTQKWIPKVTINEPSRRKVYQVRKGGAIKFLSVFSKGPLGTAYVLADQPTTEEDLGKAEQAIAHLSDILESLKVRGLEPTDESLTAQPELFSHAAAIQSMHVIEIVPPEKVFKNHLSAPLDQNRFEFPSSPQSYGGGLLYPLKRGSFMSYLNLVPSKDGKGTIIIVWRTPPA